MDFMKLMLPLFGMRLGIVEDGDGAGSGDYEDPPADDQTPPPADDKPDNELPPDFDPQRAFGENKRKGEEITSLKKQIADLEAKVNSNSVPVRETPKDILEQAMKDPDVAKDIARYKERFGADDDDVRALLRLSGHGARRSVGGDIDQINTTLAETHLNKAIDEIKSDTTFPEGKEFIEKYGNEIIPFLKEKRIDPRSWGDKKLLDVVLMSIVTKHRQDIVKEWRATPGKKIDREVLSDAGGSSGAGDGTGGLDWNAVKEYAVEIGYTAEELNDKETRKSVIESFKEREKYLKQSDK